MSNDNVSAFTLSNTGLCKRLKTKVTIKCEGKTVETIALWDTGATGSCISSDIVTKLSLIPTGRKRVMTASGSDDVNTYLVDILLPNNVTIEGLDVCDSKIGDQGLGMLIGMDIINLGDFSVSNYRGKTVFSFRIPSQCATDYVLKLNVSNKIGTHGKGKKNKRRK